MKKHYRKIYNDELENNYEIFKYSVFEKIPIYRGQSRGLKKNIFDKLFGSKKDDSGMKSSVKQVGYFKGFVQIQN